MKVRVFFLLLACALFASSATIRLYLKEGGDHRVSEYKVDGDRVRYYSIERSAWEEIPLALVDLKKTEAEIRRIAEERKEDAKMQDAEEAAERAQRAEVEAIPYEHGVFMVEGGKAIALKQAESKVVSNKRRSILSAISPIPIVSGKANVELDGKESEFKLAKVRPEFYIRLSGEERFAIVRLDPTKDTRVVQKWEIVPVTKEIVETTDILETFKQQLADGLYKIWTTADMAPGQYAVVQYTEGKGNIQVWDFAITR